MEYKIPENLKEISDYIAHISKFPNVDPPQVFGLHGSADMTFRIKEFNELLTTITTALPKDGNQRYSKYIRISQEISQRY